MDVMMVARSAEPMGTGWVVRKAASLDVHWDSLTVCWWAYATDMQWTVRRVTLKAELTIVRLDVLKVRPSVEPLEKA